MSRKRVTSLVLVLILVVLAGTASWIAGSSIQSPAEAAARTAPPTPSPILVPIEQRVLSANVVTRGTARFGLPHIISLVPSPLKGDAGVISTLPIRGTQLNEGDVLLRASGRPVFVLYGAIPAYRDLVPGSSGDDVRQLEEGLRRLGIYPGPADGIYDEQTSAAVVRWYARSGWEAFGATAEQLATIRSLEQELEAAVNSQLAAQESVITTGAAINAASGELEAATSAAQATVNELTATRNALWSDWAPDLDRVIADANLNAGKAALEAATASGRAAIQAAVDAQKAARRDVQSAAENVARIEADLAIARRAAGVKVPLDEMVFVPDLPVRVEKLELALGDPLIGAVMTVTNNQLALDSSLPLNEAPLVKPGMTVTIDEPDLGIKATGVVSRVADNPGTNGVDGFHIYFETLVDETPVSLEGFSLRLTIPVESTGGAVLVVPVSAIFLAADGTSRVQVDNGGTLSFVAVEPGLSADGFVEVTPVDGTLTPGQLVVIGFEQP